MIGLALAGLTGFSTAPLRLAALMTGLGILFGVLVSVYSVASKLSGNVAPGWTSLALIIAIFSTAQKGCLAVVSIYVVRMATPAVTDRRNRQNGRVHRLGACPRRGAAIPTGSRRLKRRGAAKSKGAPRR